MVGAVVAIVVVGFVETVDDEATEVVLIEVVKDVPVDTGRLVVATVEIVVATEVDELTELDDIRVVEVDDVVTPESGIPSLLSSGSQGSPSPSLSASA